VPANKLDADAECLKIERGAFGRHLHEALVVEFPR
jgi:hypothetical protein